MPPLPFQAIPIPCWYQFVSVSYAAAKVLHARPSFQLCSNWCLSSSFTLYLRYITSFEGCRRSGTAHLLNGRNLIIIQNHRHLGRRRKRITARTRTGQDMTQPKLRPKSPPTTTTTTSATPATAHPPTTAPIPYSYCYTNAFIGVPPIDLPWPRQSPLWFVDVSGRFCNSRAISRANKGKVEKVWLLVQTQAVMEEEL